MITLHGKIHCRKRQYYRDDLYRNQDGKCYWCQRKLRLYYDKNPNRSKPQDIMEIDHIIPRCAGGSNHFSNLVGSCKGCNVKRSHLYLKYVTKLIILDQESPVSLLKRYNSQQTTRENNKWLTQTR